MPLREHISELRSRMLKAMFFLAIGAAVGWVLYPHILGFLKEPYCALPSTKRYPPDRPGATCQLLFFGPLDGFMLRLKVGVIAGAVLSAPFWLYQLWAFITPGLHRKERRWTVVFIFSSTSLFVAGAILSYFTVSNALGLLIGFAGNGTAAAIEVSRYVGFVTSMMLVFGASFELPLLVVLLNQVGVLSARRLLRWQRVSVFLIFVFAAVATPSQDPLSMCLLAIPMSMLFEAAVLIAWLHDRRKARREALESYHDLPDDQISSLDEPASRLDDLDPIDDVRS